MASITPFLAILIPAVIIFSDVNPRSLRLGLPLTLMSTFVIFSPFWRVKNGPVGSIDETCSGWGGMTNLFHLKILRKKLGKYAKCIIIEPNMRIYIHDYLGFMESIVGMCISKSTLLFSSGITNKTRGLRSWPSEKQKKQKVTEKCLIWQVSNINPEISSSTAIYKTWPEV